LYFGAETQDVNILPCLCSALEAVFGQLVDAVCVISPDLLTCPMGLHNSTQVISSAERHLFINIQRRIFAFGTFYPSSFSFALVYFSGEGQARVILFIYSAIVSA